MAALVWTAAEAQRRDAELLAVRAWQPDQLAPLRRAGEPP
jgi:hypothetical protein